MRTSPPLSRVHCTCCLPLTCGKEHGDHMVSANTRYWSDGQTASRRTAGSLPICKTGKAAGHAVMCDTRRILPGDRPGPCQVARLGVVLLATADGAVQLRIRISQDHLRVDLCRKHEIKTPLQERAARGRLAARLAQPALPPRPAQVARPGSESSSAPLRRSLRSPGPPGWSRGRKTVAGQT